MYILQVVWIYNYFAFVPIYRKNERSANYIEYKYLYTVVKHLY